jgi:hypothetical protein
VQGLAGKVSEMDPAELLTLAAISYRGCEFNLSNAHSRKIVYDEMTRCLHVLSAVRDKWEIVWGPAGHNPGKFDLDDSAMYVARRTHNSTDIAIVIRGTNVFSLGDWLTNLRIDPMQWKYGQAEPDTIISHSTAYGLTLLQQLKAEQVPPTDAGQTAEEIEDAALISDKAAIAYAFLERILAGHEPDNIASLIENFSTVIRNLVEADDVLAKRESSALNGLISTQPSPPKATSLMVFLRNYMSTLAAPLKIWVVGHSKGGALAPAVALWLAESRHANADNWDPDNRAALHLATFAAPTPGNGNFAMRINQGVASTYRLANPYDIVPHVWNPYEVAEIPHLYGSKLVVLKPAVDLLIPWLQRHCYQHECPAEAWPPELLTERPLLTQIGINHLDIYLQKLGIYDAEVNTLALFKAIGS